MIDLKPGMRVWFTGRRDPMGVRGREITVVGLVGPRVECRVWGLSNRKLHRRDVTLIDPASPAGQGLAQLTHIANAPYEVHIFYGFFGSGDNRWVTEINSGAQICDAPFVACLRSITDDLQKFMGEGDTVEGAVAALREQLEISVIAAQAQKR